MGVGWGVGGLLYDALLGFATVSVQPMVLPKWVTQVQVWLPNLDTTQNHVPLPWYCGYKWVFQPRVSTQENQIHSSNYTEFFSPNTVE